MTPHDGRDLIEYRRSVSGRQYFDEMRAGLIPVPPLIALLGLRLVEVGDGRVVFTGTPARQYYNAMGVAHGGWAATLLDSALGCAVNTVQPAGRSFATVELTINYTRALREETGEVRCEASVIHAGSRIATADARILDARGRLYAHATTICMLVDQTRPVVNGDDSGVPETT